MTPYPPRYGTLLDVVAGVTEYAHHLGRRGRELGGYGEVFGALEAQVTEMEDAIARVAAAASTLEKKLEVVKGPG